jgi:ketosteroid isomerase-like protein
MQGANMNWRGIVVALIGCTLAVAQTPIQNPKAERSKLIALENAWNQAQVHHDGPALERLVADTYVYTDWDGTVMNKAKFIADAKDTSTKVKSAANSDVNVYFYPGVAIVTGAYHTKGNTQGKPFDHYGRFTDTWVLADGQWVCVATHTNLVKK